jgi:hypothetical protein
MLAMITNGGDAFIALTVMILVIFVAMLIAISR